MQITIREVLPNEVDALVPILMLAEPSQSALRWSLSHMSDAVYRMDMDGEAIGAATVRWGDDTPEIIELAIVSERQGQGFGKRLVNWLITEARWRDRHKILVGTSNASIGNTAFYQRCGFRIDHVRRDYFWYYREPVYENGIRVRDMLVFSFDLNEEDAQPPK